MEQSGHQGAGRQSLYLSHLGKLETVLCSLHIIIHVLKRQILTMHVKKYLFMTFTYKKKPKNSVTWYPIV